jgi:succinoglycan biosynthesis transport protein ExoP
VSLTQYYDTVARPEDQIRDFDLVVVIRVLWRARWWISLFTLISVVVALAIGYSLPKTFVAQGEVVVRAEATVAPDADRAFNSTAINEAVVATERSVMAAEGLLSRVSEQVNFPQTLLEPSWMSVQVRALLKRLSIPSSGIERPRDLGAIRLQFLKSAVGTGVEKGSSVIGVAASTPDPVFSASIVNHLLDDYMDDRVTAQRAVAQNVETALQARLKDTNDQIDAVQDRIALLMQKPGLIEGTEIPDGQRDLTMLSSQLSQARRDSAQKQAAYNSALQLRSEAQNDPSRLAELLDNGSQSASDLRRQFVEKQQDLASLTTKFGAAYPARAALQSELDILARRVNGEATRVIAQSKAELDAANQVVASLTSQFSASKLTTTSYSGTVLDLGRERDRLSNLRRIAGTINDRLIAIASQPVDPNARILTRAVPPGLPMYPNIALAGVIGFVGGLTLSSVVTLINAYLQRMRRSVLGQASLFAGPLLGCLPRMRRAWRGRAGLVDVLGQVGANHTEERLGIALDGAALELEEAIARCGAKMVAFTSALPQEGKSTVAVAMALRLARMGRKILLVHCDLHEGRACYFSKHSGPQRGKSDIAIDPATGLHILEPRTTDDPVGVLCSHEFRDILTTARRGYDLVFCDTSPALSVPDALIVARLADAVVLISEFDRKSGLDESAELSRRILATGKPVCGVIVTKVDEVDVGYAAYLGYKPARGRRITLALQQ